MAWLTVLGPVCEIVGAYATLRRDALSIHSGGDPQQAPEGRSVGAIMADLALARLSGRDIGQRQPVAVNLVMTDRSLLGSGDPQRSGDEPVHVPGFGPLPASLVRDILTDSEVPATIRRLFTSPSGRDLIAAETRARFFTGGLRHMIALRDQLCVTPWCSAPIRHADHTHPHRDDPRTAFDRGSGTCEHCNYVKENPGWRVDAVTSPSGARAITVTTPTGHTYTGQSPPLLGHGWQDPQGVGEPARKPPPPGGCETEWLTDEVIEAWLAEDLAVVAENFAWLAEQAC